MIARWLTSVMLRRVPEENERTSMGVVCWKYTASTGIASGAKLLGCLLDVGPHGRQLFKHKVTCSCYPCPQPAIINIVVWVLVLSIRMNSVYSYIQILASS